MSASSAQARLVDGKKDHRRLEQCGGLCPLGSGGSEVREVGRGLLIAWGYVRALCFILNGIKINGKRCF